MKSVKLQLETKYETHHDHIEKIQLATNDSQGAGIFGTSIIGNWCGYGIADGEGRCVADR